MKYRFDMNAQTHAQEGGHWYFQDGRPAYEVEGSRGTLVRPDRRHAKKFGLQPGVTSILRIIAAPGLEYYKQNQMMLAALTLPRTPGESDDSFLVRVRKDAQAHARERAAEGTALHTAISQTINGEDSDEKWAQHVAATLTELHKMPSAFLADFKTKASLTDVSRLFWPEHITQLAGYRLGLLTGTLHGHGKSMDWQSEVSFATRQFGGKVDLFSGNERTQDFLPLYSIMIGINLIDVKVKAWSPEEYEWGLRRFKLALELYHHENEKPTSMQEKSK